MGVFYCLALLNKPISSSVNLVYIHVGLLDVHPLRTVYTPSKSDTVVITLEMSGIHGPVSLSKRKPFILGERLVSETCVMFKHSKNSATTPAQLLHLSPTVRTVSKITDKRFKKTFIVIFTLFEISQVLHSQNRNSKINPTIKIYVAFLYIINIYLHT